VYSDDDVLCLDHFVKTVLSWPFAMYEEPLTIAVETFNRISSTYLSRMLKKVDNSPHLFCQGRNTMKYWLFPFSSSSSK
jgi:hypothetical protein